MSKATGRKERDGNQTGFKQDKFRNSRFEILDKFGGAQSQAQSQSQGAGMSYKSANTIGGPWEENRGHRVADDRLLDRYDNPFENGKVKTWRHRQGWDEYFTNKTFRSGKPGGAIIGHDEEDHTGRGPKGYSRPDTGIYEDVCETLFRSRDVDASDIEVTVKEGCIFLNGSVKNRGMKRMAEFEIEAISGVKDVQNLLSIKA